MFIYMKKPECNLHIVITLCFLLLGIQNSFSQYYTWDGKTLELDNGVVNREITFVTDSSKIVTKNLFLNGFTDNFLKGATSDFSLLVNDKVVDGYSNWSIISCLPAIDNHEGKGASIKLKNELLEITITYLLYPEMPVIRKFILLKNCSLQDLKIEALDIEKLNLSLSYVESWLYNSYARMKHLNTYVGNWDDALMVIHHTRSRSGIALGNEVPGVLKRTAYQTQEQNIEIGTTHPGQNYPFRKWLKPNESWTSPKTFIVLYNKTDNGTDILNGIVNDFTRKHLGFRFNTIAQKPVFVYNTWYPFRTALSDSLIRGVAKAAADCGVHEFVLDDGWQVNVNGKYGYGDWLVDKTKFPLGLKSTFDYIKSLGMKPGLWIAVGSAMGDSEVFKEHPEWFVNNYKNKIGNLHASSDDSGFYTSCMGTEWTIYIKKKILFLVQEYGLAYAKLDLSVLTSAYVNDIRKSGCYAENHPCHRDHEESFIAIYENVLQLFDDLHKEAPELFIDCTFETTGKLQLQDYAFAQHAEGNWLSNIEEVSPVGALRVRQMAWWRSPAMPAGSLVLGNLSFDSENFIFDLKSLIGTLPIILGDPRELKAEKRAEIKQWSDWISNMQEKYNYMTYRQDLKGFGEPQDGSWDGWQRINTESKKGGIVGLFRHGALENNRTVFVNGLDAQQTYHVRIAPLNKLITTCSGKDLMEKGFEVSFTEKYDGAIYEIEKK